MRAWVCVCVRVNKRACVWWYPGAWACAYARARVQHAVRMRHIVLSFVASLDPTYFSTSHKRQDLREKTY